MKFTLYSAISIDGYIAKLDGDSDWVSPVDNENFNQTIQDAGCMIVGRTTFDQYGEEMFPMKNVLNVVITSHPPKKNKYKNLYFHSGTALELREYLKNHGQKEAIVIGGSKTNSYFLNVGLVDKIILCVHPLILGDGMKMFADSKKDLQLQQLSMTPMKSRLVKLVYKVKK